MSARVLEQVAHQAAQHARHRRARAPARRPPSHRVRAASSATSASRSTGSGRSTGTCASSRLASRISPISSSSSAMSFSTRSRSSGRASPASSSIAMRMRASGERSSWEALASSPRCALDQPLDARRRAVEAAREGGDLVAALDARARPQIARAELLDLGAQLLEPPRDAPRHRVGADADRRRQGRDQQQPAEAVLAVGSPRHQPAPVGKPQRHRRRPAARAQESALALIGGQRGQRLADRREPRAVRTAQLDVGGEVARELLDRLLELGLRRARRREQLGEDRPPRRPGSDAPRRRDARTTRTATRSRRRARGSPRKAA